MNASYLIFLNRCNYPYLSGLRNFLTPGKAKHPRPRKSIALWVWLWPKKLGSATVLTSFLFTRCNFLSLWYRNRSPFPCSHVPIPWIARIYPPGSLYLFIYLNPRPSPRMAGRLPRLKRLKHSLGHRGASNSSWKSSILFNVLCYSHFLTQLYLCPPYSLPL